MASVIKPDTAGGKGWTSVADVVAVHPIEDVTVIAYTPYVRFDMLVPEPVPEPDGDVLVQLKV